MLLGAAEAPLEATPEVRVKRKYVRKILQSKDEFARVLGDARYGEKRRIQGSSVPHTVLDDPKVFAHVFPELKRADHERRAKKFERKAMLFTRALNKEVRAGEKTYGAHGVLCPGGYRGHWPEMSRQIIDKYARSALLAKRAQVAHEHAATHGVK